MSTSPFAFLENATLTFKVSSQLMEVDEWGNRLPIQQELVFRCWLKEDNSYSGHTNIDESIYPGISDSYQNVKGYCIEPRFLPESITHLSEAIAVINGQVGRFVLRRGIDGMATYITGSPIRGVFRRTA